MFLFQNLPGFQAPRIPAAPRVQTPQLPTLSVDDLIAAAAKDPQKLTRSDSKFTIVASPPGKLEEAGGKFLTGLKMGAVAAGFGSVVSFLGGKSKTVTDTDKAALVYIIKVPRGDGKPDDVFFTQSNRVQSELVRLVKLNQSNPNLDFQGGPNGMTPIDVRTKKPIAPEIQYDANLFGAYSSEDKFKVIPKVAAEWNGKYDAGLTPLRNEENEAKANKDANKKNSTLKHQYETQERAAKSRRETYEAENRSGYEMFRREYGRTLEASFGQGATALSEAIGRGVLGANAAPPAPPTEAAKPGPPTAALPAAVSADVIYIPPKFGGKEETDFGGSRLRSSIESNKQVIRFVTGTLTDDDFKALPALGNKQLHQLLGITQKELLDSIASKPAATNKPGSNTIVEYRFRGDKDSQAIEIGPIKVDMTQLNRGANPAVESRNVIEALALAIKAKLP